MPKQDNDKFKITNIDGATGNITVEFTIKGATSTQVISNLSLDDDKALTEALNTYAKSYRAGLQIEKQAKKSIDPKVTAMVNKSTDINEDTNAQQTNS